MSPLVFLMNENKKHSTTDERVTAAKARDALLVEAGRRDEILQSELMRYRLRSSDEQWARALSQIAKDAKRPSAANHKNALIVSGALEALEAS